MWKPLVWLIYSFPAIFAIWQLFQNTPFIPPLVSGLFLMFVGLLVGLRISANSADRYMRDLQRKNRFLADLTRDLATRNHEFMISMMDEDVDDSQVDEERDD